MPLCKCTCLLLLLCFACGYLNAQEIPALSEKLLRQLENKSQKFNERISRQTGKYLARLEREERKLQAKLQRKDSAAAQNIFGDVRARYQGMLNMSAGANQYSGYLDSMQTALRFLEQRGLPQDKIQNALEHYSSIQKKLNETGQVKKLLAERTRYLKEQLQQLGMAKEFRAFQKQVYYYRSQLDEYRRMLHDPSKLEENLLKLALKIPSFKDFFNKHSMLAGMFRLPSNNDPSTPIQGLQTRAAVQQVLEQRFGTGPNVSQAMQQSFQSAQAQLNQLKEKINSLGENGADLDMPGFKPNGYKTKSFWQRIELGANFQSARSNNFFPVTSDIGLSAGYKLNEKSIIGVGASYKLGWGSGINHIRFSHEGAGLRSFADWKIKGSFYASGGFEYNYQQPYERFSQLYNGDGWQKSGLVGVSKVVSVNSKFFKKTKVQLLWDFLSYEQEPRGQPLKFRVGYSFK